MTALRSQFRRQRLQVRDRVRGLQRRQDAFAARQLLKRVERLGIRGVRVLGSAAGAEPRVFGAHRCVVETGRHGVRQLDIAVIVLEDERPRPLQDARAAAGEARRMAPWRDALAASLDANEPHVVHRR